MYVGMFVVPRYLHLQFDTCFEILKFDQWLFGRKRKNKMKKPQNYQKLFQSSLSLINSTRQLIDDVIR